ncbi:hypothetical protein SCHPADRAFT_126077 [Schizopora paradoxa]|uniref:Uncharacterized protein n=1 Tax=Schizopora paradoxa TaxID=27342 RepID=A0A0H2S1M1_9AGAM|nr:hypothetical protein SCHPADRAFT_126077 [Schizopora paradoxa]
MIADHLLAKICFKAKRVSEVLLVVNRERCDELRGLNGYSGCLRGNSDDCGVGKITTRTSGIGVFVRSRQSEKRDEFWDSTRFPPAISSQIWVECVLAGHFIDASSLPKHCYAFIRIDSMPYADEAERRRLCTAVDHKLAAIDANHSNNLPPVPHVLARDEQCILRRSSAFCLAGELEGLNCGPKSTACCLEIGFGPSSVQCPVT